MTKGTDTYGLGIGIQLGGFAEWYQIARANGGQYLTRRPQGAGDQHAGRGGRDRTLGGPLQAGDRPAARHLQLRHGAGGLGGRQDGDLFVRPRDDHRRSRIRSRSTGCSCPIRPAPRRQVNFNDIGFYAMSSKTPDKDLAWEVIKWWTNSDSDAYWTDRVGTYPSRTDAVDAWLWNGRASSSWRRPSRSSRSTAAAPSRSRRGATIEDQAEAQIQDCYTGKTLARGGGAPTSRRSSSRKPRSDRLATSMSRVRRRLPGRLTLSDRGPA